MNKNRESVAQVRRNIVVSNNRTVACLFGRIDIDSSPAVRDLLLGMLQPPSAKIVSTDLSRDTHMDSSGIAVGIHKLLSTVPDAAAQIRSLPSLWQAVRPDDCRNLAFFSHLSLLTSGTRIAITIVAL